MSRDGARIEVATRTQTGQFSIGPWTVTPALGQLRRAGKSVAVEPLAMDVLEYLARHTNEVVSAEDLTNALWQEKVVGDDAVYQRIHRLRTVLEDDFRHARYIETIPKKGYRLIAPVSFTADGENVNRSRRRRIAVLAVFTVIAILVIASYDSWQPPLDHQSIAASGGDHFPKSIAVIPFVDIGAEHNEPYLGEGISGELIHTLSTVPDLKVVAQASTLRYSDNNVDAQGMGEQLDVGTILTGSIYKQGERLHVTARLIDAANGNHLWSRTFERNVVELYTIQRDIAYGVAQAFGASPDDFLSHGNQAARIGVDAYDYYLLGRHHLRFRELPDLEQSIAYFRRAVALNPDFARGYAGLALALVIHGYYAREPFQVTMPGAMTAVEQALALDDEESEAYAVIGLIRKGQHDLKGAELAYRRALKLNPNYAMAYMWYASFLNDVQRDDEGLQSLSKAAELDPLSAHIKLNMGYYYASHDQPEVAREHWLNAIEVEPGFWLPYNAISDSLISTGHLDDAVSMIRRYMNHVGDDTYWGAPLHLIWCYRALDDLDKAEYWLDRITASSAPASIVMHEQALAYIARGDYDETSEVLHSWASEALDRPRQLDHIAWYEMIIGHDEHALRLYEQINKMTTVDPARELGNLFNENRIGFGQLPAVNAAHLLLKGGEADRAQELLARSREFVTEWSREERFRSGALYVLASISAIEGDQQSALLGLRKAIDAGWVGAWFMLQDPNLVSLREGVEFKQLVAVLQGRLKLMKERIDAEYGEISVAIAAT